MNKNKTAQLKIQQMSFMLLAVILFFVLAGLVYLAISTQKMYQKASELNKEQAGEVASILAGTAEFRCAENKADCIDFEKVLMLKQRKAYEGFWPVSSIKIYKIYPEYKKAECTLSNFEECNLITVYDKKVKSEMAYSRFVSICHKENIEGHIIDKCELGKIVVGSEVMQK